MVCWVKIELDGGRAKITDSGAFAPDEAFGILMAMKKVQSELEGVVNAEFVRQCFAFPRPGMDNPTSAEEDGE
jgi:hypothetical protein